MHERALRLIDLVYSAGLVSGALVATTLAATILLGASLVTAKFALFVVGVLLSGLGFMAVRPAPAAPHKDELVSVSSQSQTSVERWIQTIPPLDSQPLRHPDRISRNWKLLVTGLVVLAVSAFMEFVLGISVASP
ncbi:DUF7555 family protein [Halobacterium salinarum]|uniref:Uncharacterized protein n=3 Tax=Halobacterium salinarum TaxID=2242 RepID=Q9HMX4_HALSA|nr:hypothetical protein [Halobacterium salinarum]AAG20447.1 hypothetical protein VNG_2342H [Halobacterium salinarum NRC-1]MBB6089622.1 hypothetical protein [Halobacterium salinarum]MDL0120972.1 hypothetical protein [Halobacterium salinarum]MDL0130295.1 hypothetical protein [Halobacterium salinarum]MDL0141170.1 hypothetical protein [Halobacterium salinarum]